MPDTDTTQTGPKPGAAHTPAKAGARRNPPAVITFDTLTPKDVAVLSAEAQGWRPEVADEIEGRVLDVTIGESKIIEGEKVRITRYPIVFVLRDGAREGEPAVALHCFHAISQNKVISARPEFGDRIYCKYLGQSEGKDGRKGAHLYAMNFPDAKNVASVWDRLGPTQ